MFWSKINEFWSNFSFFRFEISWNFEDWKLVFGQPKCQKVLAKIAKLIRYIVIYRDLQRYIAIYHDLICFDMSNSRYITIYWKIIYQKFRKISIIFDISHKMIFHEISIYYNAYFFLIYRNISIYKIYHWLFYISIYCDISKYIKLL